MVIRNIKTGFPFFCALAASVFMGGCSLSTPDHFSTGRLGVEERELSETVLVSQFDEKRVAEMAAHFAKSGEGPVELTVTYDPRSSKATAMHAHEEAKRIAYLLKKNGVEDVRADILPVMDSGDEMKAMFSYSYYLALPPEGCETMPGVDGRAIDAQEDYKLGCTVDTLLVRQIARPRDLKGRSVEKDSVTDGRRAANIVDRYRSGVPNEPLEGGNASDQ